MVKDKVKDSLEDLDKTKDFQEVLDLDKDKDRDKDQNQQTSMILIEIN